MDEWACYIIENRGYTYVGVSNNVKKRLRAHNGEIRGGAKYTTGKGKGWTHICIVRGFPTKIESMQFEWALKHVPPRNAGGIKNRIKKLRHKYGVVDFDRVIKWSEAISYHLFY